MSRGFTDSEVEAQVSFGDLITFILSLELDRVFPAWYVGGHSSRRVLQYDFCVSVIESQIVAVIAKVIR